MICLGPRGYTGPGGANPGPDPAGPKMKCYYVFANGWFEVRTDVLAPALFP